MDARHFLHHLERSGLLSEDQMQDAARRLDNGDVKKVAADLVAHGVLTRFQTRQLLAGNSKGFLLGRYRILEQIGQGGMGIVYKAIHTSMRRLVAMKVLRPAVSTDKEWHRHLFEREARAAAHLDHPNIVTLYDADHINGVYFLVMELVEGPSLKKRVQDRGPLAVHKASNVVCQVADALGYAHQEGFVHRDIKPSNMLLTRLPVPPRKRDASRTLPGNSSEEFPFRVKVLDFGLSRLAPEQHFAHDQDGTIQAMPGVVWGTFDYISPEQLMDVHSVDVRSDLYSLGSSFYYLLTGQVPYGGGSIQERLIRRATEEPTPVSKLRPGLPPPVARIVERLMQRLPADRFQTPDELIDALRPWCVKTEPLANSSLAAPAQEGIASPVEETAPQMRASTDADIEVQPYEHQPLCFSEPSDDGAIVEVPAGAALTTAKRNRTVYRGWLGVAIAAAIVVVLAVVGWLALV
jgi:serine/threonine protein kinase